MARNADRGEAGDCRGAQCETLVNGDVRIWWNSWAATIRARDRKILYNHLHNLTYLACRGKVDPRCKGCSKPVPQELVTMALLQQFKVGESN